MSAETEFIDKIHNLTKIVPALNPIFKFAEDLPNLIFDGVGTYGINLKLLQVWK